MKMYKYCIADILTGVRFACVAAIGIMTALHLGAEWILITFAIGELTDAFDGIAARRWHYPDDGKWRWWRAYAVVLDQAADILLAAVTILYVGLYIRVWVAVVAAVFVAAVVIPVQIWRRYRIKKYGPRKEDDPLREKVVLGRRYCYLLLLSVTAVALLVAAHWSTFTKVMIALVVSCIALVLVFVKMDRLTEDKTF